MRVKFKLFISYLVLIIFAVSLLGFLIAKKSDKAVINEVNEKNQSLTESIITTLSVRNELLSEKSYRDSNLAISLLNNKGSINVHNNENIKVGEFVLPVLYAGHQRLSLDDTIVDEIKKSAGTEATILLLQNDKLVRVSTTILKEDKRIEGTYIPSDSEVYKKITDNEEYFGVIVIEGISYFSRIKPLLDKDKKVVGAIGIGNKILNNYLEKTLSNIKLGRSGFVFILNSQGDTILHPYEKRKDKRRHDFFDKMNSSEKGTIEYIHDGIKKVGYYQYFEPWHCYVVATDDYDELNSSSKSIFTTIIITGFIIIIFGGILALFLANTLVGPINKLKACMEIAGKGDLTVRCDINSKDEIGILANSFNNMLAENERLLEEVVQYDRLKTEFIANMSHELRTPLNIIFSTVQLFDVLISKGENLNTNKIKNYTSSIRQNCYRLLRLVNNLIDMTKIDSGFMKLELRNENIVQVAEEITQSTAEYVEQMSRTIIFDTEVEEKIIAFDPEKLERILLNLISNATKFTKPGDEINVTLYDKDDHIIISVQDTGRGIPKEQLSQLFQRFKQVDSLLNRCHEGSGIGLSIVKALVELHGGTVEVKSEYGVGTEFIICLPAKVICEQPGMKVKSEFTNQSKVESISIEFSDIYS